VVGSALGSTALSVAQGAWSATIVRLHTNYKEKQRTKQIEQAALVVKHIETLKSLFNKLQAYPIPTLVETANSPKINKKIDKNKIYRDAAKILIRNNIMGISVEDDAINELYEQIKGSRLVEITVKYQGTSGEELFKLLVKGSETVETVLNRFNMELKRIGKSANIAKGNRALSFRGEILEESKSMLDCEIVQGSVLELGEKPVAPPPAGAADTSVAAQQSLMQSLMEISVKTLNGGTPKLSVNSSDTIESLKATLSEMDISLKDKELSFEDKQLEDARTFADYKIKDGSEIQVVEQ